jgi:Leucine-rich repeat (LRR) protein
MEQEPVKTKKTVSQSSLERFLESKDPIIKELRIELSLEGILDMSILKKFPRLENLVFIDGKISHLKNLPEGLKRIWCNNNHLESLDLPVSIIKVEIIHNKIKEISFSKNILLEDVDITDNYVKSLEKLPISIKSIRCSSNELVWVDMNHLENLKTFICNENRAHLYIIGYQETITHSELPIQYELKKKMNGQTEKYKQQVELFFNKKQEYENKVKNQKPFPKCKVCKQTKGFLFTITKQEYKATCKAKCTWNITIPRETYEFFPDVTDYFQRDSLEYEQKMIDLKMKTLFQHMSNTEATKQSKELLEAIDTNHVFLKKYEQQHKDMYFSTEKDMYEINGHSQIQRKLQELDSDLGGKERMMIQKEIHRISQLQFENRYPSKSVLENPKETTKLYPNYYVMLNEFPLESLEINI